MPASKFWNMAMFTGIFYVFNSIFTGTMDPLLWMAPSEMSAKHIIMGLVLMVQTLIICFLTIYKD